MPYYRENKKLRPWPLDWDIHLFKTCELFFDGNSIPSIEFVTGSSMFDSVIMDIVSGLGTNGYGYPNEDQDINEDLYAIDCRILFVCAKKTYTFMCRKDKDQNQINGLLFINENMTTDKEDKEDISEDEVINVKVYVKLLSSISAGTPFDCAGMIKDAISKDYWDNDNGDEDNPVFDPDPTGGISIKPVLQGS